MRKQLQQMQLFMKKIEEATLRNNNSIENNINLIENLNDFTNDMQKSFKNSRSAVEVVAEKIDLFANSMEEVTSATEEVNSVMDVINDRANKPSNMSEDLNAYSGQVDELCTSMSQIEDVVTDLSLETKYLNENDNFKMVDDDFKEFIDDAIDAHKSWIVLLEDMVRNMKLRPLQTDHDKCKFRYFYNAVKPEDERVKKIWVDIEPIHNELHNIGKQTVDAIRNNSKDEANKFLNRSYETSEKLICYLKEIKDTIK